MAGADLGNQLDILDRVGAVGDLSDAQLLRRFLATRDEAARAAFAALVDRHGPMVARVCGQILGDPHEVQDAFQATFLILASKAHSVRKADSVASWLHGVALRVGGRARADAARRRGHERRLAATRAGETARDQGPPERWPELHEEVARLPDRFREPVVLCYLEGLSTEAAALRLGCPRGTVLSRLARARERLRARLVRRGLGMPAALAAPGPIPGTTPLLPACLLDPTVRASLIFAGRWAVDAALGPVAATTLARGVMTTMALSKLKTIAAASLAGALALGGVRTFGQFGGSAPGQEPAAAVPKTGDDPAALARSLSRLEAELDESNRRQAAIRQELKEIRAKLKAEPEAPKPVPAPDIARPATSVIEVTGPADAGGGKMGPGGRMIGPDGRPIGPRGRPGDLKGGFLNRHFIDNGKLIIATPPEGGKAAIYDKESRKTHIIQFPTTKDAPLTVIPIIGPGSVGLLIRGPKIAQVAAASALTGEWYKQDLLEPVAGEATPIVGPGVVAYGLGRHVYAFSPEARRWGVVKLPEGAVATPIVGPGAVTVEAYGHILTFSSKTGEWGDLDFNKIFDEPEVKEKDRPEAGP